MSVIDIKVPDIGDFSEVTVIELLVKPGDTVKAEQSLITVESDKASMEIPSSHAGVVKELKVKLGDKVSEGSLVLVLEVAGETSAQNQAPALSEKAQAATPVVAAAPALAPASAPAVAAPAAASCVRCSCAPLEASRLPPRCSCGGLSECPACRQDVASGRPTPRRGGWRRSAL